MVKFYAIHPCAFHIYLHIIIVFKVLIDLFPHSHLCFYLPFVRKFLGVITFFKRTIQHFLNSVGELVTDYAKVGDILHTSHVQAFYLFLQSAVFISSFSFCYLVLHFSFAKGDILMSYQPLACRCLRVETQWLFSLDIAYLCVLYRGLICVVVIPPC